MFMFALQLQYFACQTMLFQKIFSEVNLVLSPSFSECTSPRTCGRSTCKRTPPRRGGQRRRRRRSSSRGSHENRSIGRRDRRQDGHYAMGFFRIVQFYPAMDGHGLFLTMLCICSQDIKRLCLGRVIYTCGITHASNFMSVPYEDRNKKQEGQMFVICHCKSISMPHPQFV